MKPKFSIILVGPKGDANIGAAARAMKNFGILDLRLVDAVSHLTKTSYMWAVEAKDVLENAKLFPDLDGALENSTCAVTFTRRTGKRRRAHMDISEAAPWLVKKAHAGGVALVFGREDKGLSNAEVKRCDAVVTIPTSSALPSLNLAQAIVIACHEIFKCSKMKRGPRQEFVPKEDIQTAIERLEGMLTALDYDNKPPSRLRSKILLQFERLFGRGGLTSRDVGMLHGLAARIMGKIHP